MSERCNCSHEIAVPRLAIGARGAAKATDTVQAISERSSRALETMKALGINHCCGAHLTLAEAAASAGLPFATVLARLDEALAAEVAR